MSTCIGVVMSDNLTTQALSAELNRLKSAVLVYLDEVSKRAFYNRQISRTKNAEALRDTFDALIKKINSLETKGTLITTDTAHQALLSEVEKGQKAVKKMLKTTRSNGRFNGRESHFYKVLQKTSEGLIPFTLINVLQAENKSLQGEKLSLKQDLEEVSKQNNAAMLAQENRHSAEVDAQKLVIEGLHQSVKKAKEDLDEQVKMYNNLLSHQLDSDEAVLQQNQVVAGKGKLLQAQQKEILEIKDTTTKIQSGLREKLEEKSIQQKTTIGSVSAKPEKLETSKVLVASREKDQKKQTEIIEKSKELEKQLAAEKIAHDATKAKLEQAKREITALKGLIQGLVTRIKKFAVTFQRLVFADDVKTLPKAEMLAAGECGNLVKGLDSAMIESKIDNLDPDNYAKLANEGLKAKHDETPVARGLLDFFKRVSSAGKANNPDAPATPPPSPKGPH